LSPGALRLGYTPRIPISIVSPILNDTCRSSLVRDEE
jgi:hypothetical protein